VFAAKVGRPGCADVPAPAGLLTFIGNGKFALTDKSVSVVNDDCVVFDIDRVPSVVCSAGGTNWPYELYVLGDVPV